MTLFCPNCFAEYVEGHDVCSDCNIKLVPFEELPKSCSVCGKKYPKGTKFCPDCKVELVSFETKEDFMAGEPKYIEAEPITVFETSSVTELALIKGALEGAGIPYNARGEHVQNLFGAGLIGGFNPITGTIKIEVEKKRSEEAKRIIEDLFKNTQ
jgi:hypothetical protein